MEQHLDFYQDNINSDVSNDIYAKSGAPIALSLSLKAKGEPFSEQSVNFINNVGSEIKLCPISDEERYPRKPPHKRPTSSNLNENREHTCVCG